MPKPTEQNIIWRPHNGAQTEILTRPEYELGYGGARGGGKTEAGIAFMSELHQDSRYRGLVLRKNAEDLKDWIDRANRFYTQLGAEHTGNPGQFVFPSGAIIRLGHLKDKDAFRKYQGHEYHRILIEELTHIASEDSYLMVIGSCRSKYSDIVPQIFTTFNPDGPGFYWVRRRFHLDPEQGNLDSQGVPRGIIYIAAANTDHGRERVFVPAKLEDNPTLKENDPGYEKYLEGLPDGLKQAWRYGSWYDPIIKGAYYLREMNEAKEKQRIGRVPIDLRLKAHFVFDIGINDTMSVGGVQRTSIDTRFVYYNEGVDEAIPFYLSAIDSWLRENKLTYGYLWLPHDAKNRNAANGKSPAQTAKELGWRVKLIKRTDASTRVSAARLMFPHTYFEKKACEPLLNALRVYRREYDEELLAYKDVAVHDWSSHPADMFGYTAQVEDKMTNEDSLADTYKEPKHKPMSKYEGGEVEDEGPSIEEVGLMGHGKAPRE